MKKAQEFRDQTQEELEATYSDSINELFQLRNEAKQTVKPEKTHLIRHKKKIIARLLTVIREKQLANQ